MKAVSSPELLGLVRACLLAAFVQEPAPFFSRFLTFGGTTQKPSLAQLAGLIVAYVWDNSNRTFHEILISRAAWIPCVLALGETAWTLPMVRASNVRFTGTKTVLASWSCMSALISSTPQSNSFRQVFELAPSLLCLSRSADIRWSFSWVELSMRCGW